LPGAEGDTVGVEVLQEAVCGLHCLRGVGGEVARVMVAGVMAGVMAGVLAVKRIGVVVRGGVWWW